MPRSIETNFNRNTKEARHAAHRRDFRGDRKPTVASALVEVDDLRLSAEEVWAEVRANRRYSCGPDTVWLPAKPPAYWGPRHRKEATEIAASIGLNPMEAGRALQVLFEVGLRTDECGVHGPTIENLLLTVKAAGGHFAQWAKEVLPGYARREVLTSWDHPNIGWCDFWSHQEYRYDQSNYSYKSTGKIAGLSHRQWGLWRLVSRLHEARLWRVPFTILKGMDHLKGRSLVIAKAVLRRMAEPPSDRKGSWNCAGVKPEQFWVEVAAYIRGTKDPRDLAVTLAGGAITPAKVWQACQIIGLAADTWQAGLQQLGEIIPAFAWIVREDDDVLAALRPLPLLETEAGVVVYAALLQQSGREGVFLSRSGYVVLRDERSYHVGSRNASEEEALRRAEEAWLRQDQERAYFEAQAEAAAEVVAELSGFLDGSKSGVCPLIRREDSYRAGNCLPGTEEWVARQGWRRKTFVPGVALIPHLGDERVRRVVVGLKREFASV